MPSLRWHARRSESARSVSRLLAQAPDVAYVATVTMGLSGCWSKGNAAASAGAAGPFYGTTGRRKQRVAAAELSVAQDLSKDYGQTGSSGRRRLRRGSSTFRGTTGRTDPPDGYAGVHRGKQTTRPRDLPGASWRVSPMLGILGQSFYTLIDRQGSGRVAK